MKREELLSTYLSRLIILLCGFSSMWSVESLYAYDFILVSSFVLTAVIAGLCPLKLCNSGKLKTAYILACTYGIVVTLLTAFRYEYTNFSDILFIALLLSIIASFSIMIFMKIKYGTIAGKMVAPQT